MSRRKRFNAAQIRRAIADHHAGTDPRGYSIVPYFGGMLGVLPGGQVSLEDLKSALLSASIPFECLKGKALKVPFYTGSRVGLVEWESELTSTVAENLQISRGDAQGIIEAQSERIIGYWDKGMSAGEVAVFICNEP